MNKIVTLFLMFFLWNNVYGAVGKLTEVTGPTQVSRASTKLDGKVDVGIEIDDTIETLKSRVGITFEDGTRVQCTEFSKLVIDTFVYDPSSGKGKLAMKATMGTVRYASGLIAKNNKEEVKVKTPTASISVRGTDFSMTVDELGRSLVILLPSQPQFGPSVVGQITVSNGLGTVVLTKAYQATFIASSSVVPSSPVLLNFDDESKVNNMLLIDTPKNVTQAAKEAKKASVGSEKEDDGADKNKKMEKKETKSESKSAGTSVAQVDGGSTQAPIEETHSTINAIQENVAIKLDINAISPSTNIAVMDAIAEKQSVQPTSISIVPISPIISIPNSTVNNGFTTNGTHAILYITNGNNVVWYTLKADANAIFNITQNTESKEYPLNFGSKLKVNIIQK
jgi:hypothetical protein